MTPKTLLVGLSGVSSSGKTTLARLLCDIFPNSFITHEDDFYWPDSRIPVKNGIQDWDCLEAIDVARLASSLQYIKQHSASPPDLMSKEDQNSTGECEVEHALLERLKSQSKSLFSNQHVPRLAIVDGFLLYSEELKEVRDLLDLKILLRADYKTAKMRREARSGYATVEGFWEDPPGYVDQIVWPNYVRDHSFLFKEGDVEGSYDMEACLRAGVRPLPHTIESNMTATLEWAVQMITEALRSQIE